MIFVGLGKISQDANRLLQQAGNNREYTKCELSKGILKLKIILHLLYGYKPEVNKECVPSG